jgi:hypothetical protein
LRRSKHRASIRCHETLIPQYRSVIIHNLRERAAEGIKLAYLYCNYKSRNQNALNLIGSLLRQLLESLSEIPTLVVTSYKTHMQEKTTPLLEDFSKLLQSQISQYEKAYIVIDAVDECVEDERALMLATLSEIQEVFPTLYLLTTSREIDIIGYDLEDAVPLDITARDNDIRKYLESKLAVTSRLRSLIRSEKTLEKKIKDTLISEAKGMYVSHARNGSTVLPDTDLE